MPLFIEDTVHLFAPKFSNFCQEKPIDSLQKLGVMSYVLSFICMFDHTK